MRDDPTAGTVVQVTQISAVGVCPRCGARLLSPVPDVLAELAEAERAITAGYLTGAARIRAVAA